MDIPTSRAAAALVAAIDELDVAITGINARIEEHIPIKSMIANRADGTTIRAEVSLSVEASDGMLGSVKAMLEAEKQSKVDALTALGS